MEIILDRILFWSSSLIELMGILAIVLGILFASLQYSWKVFSSDHDGLSFKQYRTSIGRAILLGLEFLVAADIIATVGIHPSWKNVGVLAIIVLIRTFLSYSIELEISGKFPWQRKN